MHIPSFDAAHGLDTSRGPDRGELSGRPGVFRRRADAPAASLLLGPAMRDPTQQAYADCLVECKTAGGTNCPTLCAKQTKPPVTYPSPSGPSSGVAACCFGLYTACLAGVAGGGPAGAARGFIGCDRDYVACLTSPPWPCNQL